MAAPIAADAVARMIAIAATNTRAGREIASLVFLDIGIVTRFGFRFRLVYLAWSNSRLRFYCPFAAFNSQLLFQTGCFDFRVVLQKFRMVPSHPRVDGLVPFQKRIVK